ncbi:MAG TPA: hypothetical protein VD864_12080, partial [Nocardioides sp.]|nr:hypothetical protein [Nocardioides sp.]
DQVVTIQDDGLDGWLPAGADVVQVSAYGGRGSDRTGTYVYDLRTDRLLRVSEDLSSWEIGRQVGNPRQFFWHTPVNQRRGDEQHLGELLP